jgi:tryptophan synthase alpha chain
MSLIRDVFHQAMQQGNGVLIGYIMAGDPRPGLTPQIADALISGGVEILELGLPFSDPIADGPTIQAASVRALAAKTTPMKVLEIAKEIKQQHNVPIVIMTYYNPVFRIGVDKFLSIAKEHLVDGFIIPDLPLEEAADYRKAAEVHDLDTIFLASPSTTNERLRKIVFCSTGFVYLVSHYGVTGVKTTIENSTVQLIKRILPYTAGKIPLAVGFGISKPEHVERVIAAGADAAIVGSAFIDLIQKNSKNTSTLLNQLKAAAQALKTATKTSK